MFRIFLVVLSATLLCSCAATEDLHSSTKPYIFPKSKVYLINTFKNSFNSSTAVNAVRYKYSGSNQKCLDENNIISFGTPPWGRYTMVNQYKNFLFSFQPQQKIEDAFKSAFKNIKITNASFNNDVFQRILEGKISTKNNHNIEDVSKYLNLSPFIISDDTEYVVIVYPDIGSNLLIRDPYGVDNSYARAIGFGGYFNDRSILGSGLIGLFSNISKPIAFADADKIHFNIGVLLFDAKQKKFIKHYSYINEFSFVSDKSELNKLLSNPSVQKNDLEHINHMCEFNNEQIGIIDRFMREKIDSVLKKVVSDIIAKKD